MRMYRPIWIGAWLMLAIGGGSAAAEIIRAVGIVNAGQGAVDESFVRSHLTQVEGQTLNRDALNRDVKALLATGRFVDVRVDSQPATNGVALVFSVQNKLRLVEPVEVVGATVVGAKRVREWMGLYPGDYVDGPTLSARAAKVREEYRKDIFPAIDVQWVLRNPTADWAAVTVEVTEGARRGIKRVRFPGNVHLSDWTVRRTMNVPQRWNPFYWFSRKPCDTNEINAALESLRSLYVDQGYLDAEAGSPVLVEYAAGKMEMRVPVQEGPLYGIGTIGLKGQTLFSEADLRAALVTRTRGGDVASGEKITAGSQCLRDFYESRGYMGTMVRPVLNKQAAPGIVDLVYMIREGRYTTIRNIAIRGNARTRDHVIRRELLVSPGEVYDGVKIRRSEGILRNLGYFSEQGGVAWYPENTAATDQCDLVFQLEEKPTGNLGVGAAFSSEDDLFGYVEYGQGNFDWRGWPYVGGGQKLKARVEIGTQMRNYRLGWSEPWFLDRRLDLGVDLYSEEHSYDEYDTKRVGTDVNLGMSLGRPYRLDLGYQLEHAEITDSSDTNAFVDPGGTEFYYNQENITLSSFRATVSRRVLDNMFLPTRGENAYIRSTLYGGPLGFDGEFYSLEASYARYIPLPFHHVFSMRVRSVVMDNYGDSEEIPLTERLYAGGSRTVRGFKYRSVGPKAFRADGTEDSEQPCGGQSMVIANLEYSVPLFPKLRLAAFSDAGRVNWEAYDFDIAQPAVGAGIGLRFDLPFPIRLDYTWPIQKDDPYTETRRFSMALGTMF